MARRKTRTLTELEHMIMKALWERGEATVEELRAALEAQDRPLALPSVRTMLGILREKGYAARRKEGRVHVYWALISEERAQRRLLRDVIERAFDGSARNLVAALIDMKTIGRGDLDRARRLIQKHEARARQSAKERKK